MGWGNKIVDSKEIIKVLKSYIFDIPLDEKNLNEFRTKAECYLETLEKELSEKEVVNRMKLSNLAKVNEFVSFIEEKENAIKDVKKFLTCLEQNDNRDNGAIKIYDVYSNDHTSLLLRDNTSFTSWLDSLIVKYAEEIEATKKALAFLGVEWE